MSPLAQLYSTSVMEHHHFDQCIMILNTKVSRDSSIHNLVEVRKQEDNEIIVQLVVMECPFYSVVPSKLK